MTDLEDRLRLTTEHFMVLPAIVRATDLAVVMPRNIARGFAEEGHYAIVEPPFPLHNLLLGAGRLGLTQLANLDRLPATGALLVVAPLRLVGGTGSPSRVYAFVGNESS